MQKLNTNYPIVLFGLGSQFKDYYKQIVQFLGQEPDYLCDNASDKWGTKFFGKKCISIEELNNLEKNVNIVITIRSFETVFNQLQQMGIMNIYLAYFDRTYDYLAEIKPLNHNLFKKFNNNFFEYPVAQKWTFITGASRGIGAQISQQMAKLGSNLILHSRKIEHTKELVSLCSSSKIKVLPIAADLSNPVEVEKLLKNLEYNFPSIDIIFNNAGISLPSKNNPWEVSADSYLEHFNVNANAPIQICNNLIPKMIGRGFGKIINVSSTLQKHPLEIAYTCSKAALNKFVFDIAPSLEGTGVMISLTCPGHVSSDMGGENAPHSIESVIPGILLGALLNDNVNGRWFIAHDYTGLSIPEAMNRAMFLV